jgi:F-type H+-transporting ATPase subunit c
MELDIGTIFTSLTIVLGSAIPAAMVGKIGKAGLDNIGRNPEAANDIRTSMILAIAFAEAIAIYALVIALVLKFV